MHSIELKCIELFNSVNWGDVGKGDEHDNYYLLLLEFFRRATILADKYNISCNSPWGVIREIMPNGYHLSGEAEEIIECISKRSHYMRVYINMTLFTFTVFEMAKDLAIIDSNEKNIYSHNSFCFRKKHGQCTRLRCCSPNGWCTHNVLWR